jgi:6-pyruvoyltetrahydropterin/6-carboxytetrahydropterin synthase
MKIAKEFNWEMGHRLQNHKGLCRNLHGHSYKMRVELEGEIAENSMLMDYSELKQIVSKIIEPFDHSFLIEETDKILNFLQENNFKMVVVPFVTTAENLCIFLANEIKNELKQYSNIKKLTVRVCETTDVFAEQTINC